MAPMQMHSSPFELTSSGEKRHFRGRRDHFERIEPSRKEPEQERGEAGAMKRGRRTEATHDYSDNYGEAPQQRTLVAEPHENDVCLGRGGTANKHTGNEKLRQFARLQSENYRSSSKKGKSMISRLLVKQMHELDPPCRFIKKDADTGLWEEVPDDTAREKASQVLRDAVALLESEGGAAGQAPTVATSQVPAVAASQAPAVAASQAPAVVTGQVPTVAASQAAVPDPGVSSRAALSSQAVTPALESAGSSAFRQNHPGSPSSASRSKRRRYSAETQPQRTLSNDPLDVYSSNLSHSPMVRQHPQQIQYHLPRRSRSAASPSSRGRSLHHDTRHAHSADSSPVRRGSTTGSLGSGVPANMNEFDLFHGELLESDPEDQEDPLPPGSHRDLF